MDRQLSSAAMIGLVALALPVIGHAQPSPLVGTWSTTFYLNDGRGWASVWANFDANGRCQERITVQAGIVTHLCRYQISADARTVQILFTDYAPRTIPPARPINQWLTAQLQWESRDLFYVIEATGPVRYVRQR